MNAVTTSPSPAAPPTFPRADVLVAEGVTIPGWVVDLESFRRWAVEDSERRGVVSFLDGKVYVDLLIEELFTHNQVKGAFAVAIETLLGADPPGMFVHDRMLLSNPAAELSTEPDGLYLSWEALESKRLSMVEGADGIVELLGTPDMVLEVVSKGSVSKDGNRLRQLYWKAGIPEYWLVDARGETPRFDLLHRGDAEYVAAESFDSWVVSTVFGRQFRIAKETNRIGKPRFRVEVRKPDA